MPVPSTSTGLAITNPLVLYRSLLATKRIDPDPAQHRLAIHLGKLYDQLIDYEPIVQYGHRLNQISKALGTTPGSELQHDAVQRQDARSRSFLLSLWQRKEEQDSLSLTRVLTNHEAAMTVNSPRGLMLHGEVGTGKSMLIDLFADCLPNRKKRRFHYTTFMLETMAKLEHLRRSRHTIIPASMGQSDDYSLLWLARELISTSPILFLDEFQLPDRAASKIITNLMTSFFHLGGVLIATSNRMPEELAKAAGMDFAPTPPSRMESLGWKFGMRGTTRPGKSEAMFSTKSDFSAFLDVLKARCEVWEMESARDYRRRESEIYAESTGTRSEGVAQNDDGFAGFEAMAPGNVGLGYEQSLHVATATPEKLPSMAGLPKHYMVIPASEDTATITNSTAFQAAYSTALSRAFPATTPPPLSDIPWTPSSMRVYGRTIPIPRQHDSVTHWTFAELCASNLGPADYITLASTYHTLILTDVPILTTLHKNEARRFITLLDSLYEAKCKLLITAAAGPDELFFPEKAETAKGDKTETVDQDAVYSETIAEVYQDATAPFRPNISSYDPGVASPVEPDFTHARLAGMSDAGQLEDEPFHRPRASSPNYAIDAGDGMESLHERDLRRTQEMLRRAQAPDFTKGGIFTGEDERFAYKRARSRLWEMCGERWWARMEEGWWKPVDASVRRWERSLSDVVESAGSALPATASAGQEQAMVGEGIGGVREVNERDDEVMFRHGASPFRTSREPPPKIGDEHVWGVVQGWGKRAGVWGKGPEGVEMRKEEREKQRREEAEMKEKEKEAFLKEWKRTH